MGSQVGSKRPCNAKMNNNTVSRYNFRDQLQLELDRKQEASMKRDLRIVTGNGRIVYVDGQPLINLASNDYLGIANHPHIKQAAQNAIEKFGTGTGASKLVTGHFQLHHQVEKQFAQFKHAESALLFPTGYMANLAVLTALAQPGDLVCQDKLNHASLIDAARACGAQVRSYPHLETKKLQRLLKRHYDATEKAESTGEYASEGHPCRKPRRFIVSDSIFSMDGDAAQLPSLIALAKEYDAILIVDEAHGTGVLGQEGTGLCEAQGVADQVDVIISTASKALGGLGGIVTADKVICETLVNNARSLIYTTSIPPSQAATIGGAVDVVQDEPERRKRLHEMCLSFRNVLLDMKWDLPDLVESTEVTPIFPLILGSPEKAVSASESLRDAGFLASAIRYPTVPPGADRVRLSLRADLTDEDISKLIDAVKAVRTKCYL